jgi:hypothetical protein
MELIGFLLLIGFVCANHEGFVDPEDQNSELITFYDLNTKEPFSPPVTTVVNQSEMSKIDNIFHVRFPFIGQPCQCRDTTCGCCAGMKIQQFNFDRKSE